MIATLLLAAVTTVAPPMTLGDAISFALDHNPAVAQQYAAVQSAEHSLAVARGTALPTVNGSLQSYMQKNSNYGGIYEIIGEQQQSVFSQNTAQIGTNYTLDTGGLSFLQLASARASAEQAEETLANTEDQIATNVTSAFYDVVQKRAIVDVDVSDLQYQNVLVDAARAKEKAGVAAGVDVLRAEVAQAKSASTLVGARADVENAQENLAQSIGASLDQRFTFPKTIAEPGLPAQSVDTLEDIALNARPDVKAARDGVQAALFTRKGWDRELFPQVQLSASFGNQFAPTSAGEVIGVTSSGSLVTLPRGAPGFWSLGMTSTFTLPLVDWGQRHAERVSDDAQVTSAQRALDQARTQVLVDVRQTYRAAQTALAQLSYARDESRLGTESARIAQLQYARGLIALSDVIQAQQQSVTAQSDLVSARVSYVDAIVKLRVSLGTYTAQSAVADLK
ncbi:MAG TPA: TolC family protein [Candidatus Acidoferrales bacterium]|nr:TolC family protein [Candidatus Acidoferrales bacterium]